MSADVVPVLTDQSTPVTSSPVRIVASDDPGQPVRTPELEALYRGFEEELMVPLWTEIGDLMPAHPRSRAIPHVWRWDRLLPMAEKAGEIVPVGRGGERRAIALANPGLGGAPFATPTLWAAIQYLNPGEDAPVHRHTQNAFRFVLEGEGVWTVVNGDSVAMSRGDFLPQAGWNWHGHHNQSREPMAWLDGLDIPFAHYTESTFFEFGPDSVGEPETPSLSRSERLWAHPALRPLTRLQPVAATPLLAYRWVHTDRALAEQLRLEREGEPVTVEPGHAAVRYVNPATGGDVMPTIRAEMHRLAADTRTTPERRVGSSVVQVFEGRATVTVGRHQWTVQRGDVYVVPSWEAHSIETEHGVDLFSFSDAPVFEALHQHRAAVGAGQPEGSAPR